MKLSLRWIFDHIDADWRSQDPEEIIKRFNKVTAEIERHEVISFDLSPFGLGVIESFGSQMTVSIPEWGQKVSIPARKDIKEDLSKKQGYLIKKEGSSYRFATGKDFGLEKEGLLPPFQINENLLKGGWRSLIETDDVVFEVDNKSITHRPDMWGHRGFAREIAAFMGLKLKPASAFLASPKVDYFSSISKPTKEQRIIVENEAPQACLLFSGLYFEQIENRPSSFKIASRLLRVGSKPINEIVDLTNYIMLDWSQPSHAYDPTKLKGSILTVRMAQKGEKLTVLDGTELELCESDCVVADSAKPVGLAGIMGGLHDSISQTTNSLYLESANWAAGIIRKTTVRYHIRTEASARYEKTLDPSQAPDAIRRFLSLAQQEGLSYKAEDSINVIGSLSATKSINITHSFIQNRSGVTLAESEVKKILTSLEFGVGSKSITNDIEYHITIPPFRASKDIGIKEDIVEEIVRCYGFEKIPLVLPKIEKHPRDLSPIMRLRKIRQYLSTAAHMTEQQNYSFYDGEFLQQTSIQITEALELANPVAQTNKLLITSLIPHLFKNCKENMHGLDELRYFEWGRIWPHTKNDFAEQRSLAGVIFHKKQAISFYEVKQCLEDLFTLLSIPVEWKKIESNEQDWYAPYQTAHIIHEGKVIGTAGKVPSTFIHRIESSIEGDAFIFELDGDFLMNYQAPAKKYVPFSRFQGVSFDLSFLLPLSTTRNEIQSQLRSVDSLVEEVQLIDFFEKEEWGDARSLAFRLFVSHHEKTLTKEEIETVRLAAIKVIEKAGGQLRG